jgi:acetyl esterase/lipase
VLLIPPAEFKGAEDEGVISERWATKDLQAAGFLVFQIEHRLAPPGLLDGQPGHSDPASGRPPEQSDDVKRQILAALADNLCNGKIYLIGGSSGGTHALWVALDASSGAVSGWNDTVRQKIKAVVSLSGLTDLANWTDYDPGFDIVRFEDVVENYTNLQSYDYDVLEAASPISLVSSATSCPPIMLYASDHDMVPHQQSENMYNALTIRFSNVDFAEYTLPDTNLHAFNYWHTQNTVSTIQDCISHQVITFLESHP